MENGTIKDNNCGLRCIKLLLKIDERYSIIRKKINIELGRKISVIDLYNIYNSLKSDQDKKLKIINSDNTGYIDLNKKNYIYMKK